jgi:hypothetical protein
MPDRRDGPRPLRQLLKLALRSFGMKAVSVRELAAPTDDVKAKST